MYLTILNVIWIRVPWSVDTYLAKWRHWPQPRCTKSESVVTRPKKLYLLSSLVFSGAVRWRLSCSSPKLQLLHFPHSSQPIHEQCHCLPLVKGPFPGPLQYTGLPISPFVFIQAVFHQRQK